VTLILDMPEPAPAISTDAVAARQVLVNLFSYAISQAEPGPLQIQCEPRESRQTIRLTYTPQPNTSAAALAGEVIDALIEHLDWRLETADNQGEMREVTIWMAARCSTILVIDDNEGLVALLQDYLSGHMCRVVSATEGDEGLGLAQRLMPDAIVLDVMMPGMDGWELLQRLRNHPATGNVPVVVCSVIKNPNLAFSLGATDFLAKPVSRDDVLNALRALGAA
jgi:CheY-like chemotaxis protein